MFARRFMTAIAPCRGSRSDRSSSDSVGEFVLGDRSSNSPHVEWLSRSRLADADERFERVGLELSEKAIEQHHRIDATTLRFNVEPRREDFDADGHVLNVGVRVNPSEPNGNDSLAYRSDLRMSARSRESLGAASGSRERRARQQHR